MKILRYLKLQGSQKRRFDQEKMDVFGGNLRYLNIFIGSLCPIIAIYFYHLFSLDTHGFFELKNLIS